MAVKYCVLTDGKICDDCGECQRCDLDPEKICDNCMKCVNTGADYAAVQIDAIIEDESAPAPARRGPRASDRWRMDR